MFKNFSQLKNGITKLVEEKDEMYMNVDFLKCQKNETFTFNFNEEEDIISGVTVVKEKVGAYNAKTTLVKELQKK